MPNTKKVESRYTIVSFLDMVTRRRYLFLAIFALITIIGIVYSYMAPKVYTASATILVEKDKIINPLIQGLAVTQTPAERLTTIRQLILSRSRLTQVIKKLDLDLKIKTPLELEMLIERMRESTSIEITGKNLYRISYGGDNPKVVQNVVNTICNLFIEENLGATRGHAQDAFSFIEAQLSTYKKKLEESETAIRVFKEQNLGQLPGEEGDNLKKLEEYRNLLTETERELQEARLQKSLLEHQLAAEQPLILFFSSSSSDTQPLENQLAQLKLQLSYLLNKYTEKYPEVISTKAQIEKIEQKIAEEAKNKNKNKSRGEKKASEEHKRADSTTEALNPMYQQMRQDLGNIEIKIDVLAARVQEYKEKTEEYEQRVQNIPKLEEELIQLQRGYDVNAGIYKTLLNKLEEARISRELELREKGSNFQIIDLAQLPLIPSKPKRPQLIVISMALGLLSALATIYLLQHFDSSPKNLDEARAYFDYPVLAGIPLIISEEDKKRKRKGDILFLSTAGMFVISVLLIIVRELAVTSTFTLFFLK
ncbi:MAG: XrtA system polysaccharide chain length determinant [bacterium]